MPRKIVDDVCRLCDTTFTDKRNKHNLITGASQVKPPYTLALEELIGFVKTSDELRAACKSCRTLLNKYDKSSCEVERIGMLIKSVSAAHAAARFSSHFNLPLNCLKFNGYSSFLFIITAFFLLLKCYLYCFGRKLFMEIYQQTKGPSLGLGITHVLICFGTGTKIIYIFSTQINKMFGVFCI